jgi:hypothetical protein
VGRLLAGAVVLIVLAGVSPGRAEERPQGAKVERYPPSWRIQVKEAIDRAVLRLRALQGASGAWGNREDIHAVGHSALPLLAMLKAGVPPEDEAVQRTLKLLRSSKLTSTYGVGCYLMAIQALYHPTLDTADDDVGTARAKRVDPEVTRARLTAEDLAAIEAGVRYFQEAQADNGLWHYHVQPGPARGDYDLSNTQYALLGLRAAADCGVPVPSEVWHRALRRTLDLQEREGPSVDLETAEVRDGYAVRSRERSLARGFRYKLDTKDGPRGKGTVLTRPVTGAMTCSGVACVMICTEGLWRSRRFTGRERKLAADSVRDGMAWLQEHYSVAENPGQPKEHHGYYLYSLERAGMMTGRRWIGAHDWYKEGADLLLGLQLAHGGWGEEHTSTAFGILFLKRATQPPPAITGG